MRKLVFVAIFTLLTTYLNAQELKCNVQVNSQQITGSEKAVFDKMQQALFEFMNQTHWTNDVFAENERIECTFLLSLSERIGTSEFKGTLQIQAKRPVYDSNYNTTIFSFLDKDIHFTFEQFQQLVFSETNYQSELTSIFAFYAYYVIGLDYDTFGEEAGNEHLRKAMTVVNSAQTSAFSGWKAGDSDQNRYWLVNNYLNPQFKYLRKAMYTYHRLGLDQMSSKLEEGRAQIADAIVGLEKVHSRNPGSLNMNVFFTSKADEVVNIFTEATPQEKTRVVPVLNRIDAGNQTKYQKILKGK